MTEQQDTDPVSYASKSNVLDFTLPVARIDQPGLSYEYDEFVIRRDPTSGRWWAGSDGGCSCYDGFDPANFEPFDSVGSLRRRFHDWIGGWYDGVGHEAAAWEEFHKAVKP